MCVPKDQLDRACGHNQDYRVLSTCLDSAVHELRPRPKQGYRNMSSQLCLRFDIVARMATVRMPGRSSVARCVRLALACAHCFLPRGPKTDAACVAHLVALSSLAADSTEPDRFGLRTIVEADAGARVSPQAPDPGGEKWGSARTCVYAVHWLLTRLFMGSSGGRAPWGERRIGSRRGGRGPESRMIGPRRWGLAASQCRRYGSMSLVALAYSQRSFCPHYFEFLFPACVRGWGCFVV